MFCVMMLQFQNADFVTLSVVVVHDPVVLSDQVKSLDWRARRAELIAGLPQNVTGDVLGKLGALLA